MMSHAMDDLNNRRLEWKCNAANKASMNAARRLGFTFEGTFRQAAIVKGANRDTAWFSLLDGEWPGVKAGFERWLSPNNFAPNNSDSDGQQIFSLAHCRQMISES